MYHDVIYSPGLKDNITIILQYMSQFSYVYASAFPTSSNTVFL